MQSPSWTKALATSPFVRALPIRRTGFIHAPATSRHVPSVCPRLESPYTARGSELSNADSAETTRRLSRKR